MMISRLISDGSAVRVLEYTHNDSMVEVMQPDGFKLILNRHAIETPVECCDRCGLPAQMRAGQPSCPDHLKHEVQDLLSISQDKAKYNRVTRRKAKLEARLRMKLWSKVVIARRARGYKPAQAVKFEDCEIQPCVAMPSPTRTRTATKTGRTMPVQG